MSTGTPGLTDLVDSTGKRVVLGRELGRGGEGAVFDAPSVDSDRVIKIYHDPVKPVKQEKLKAMVQAQTPDLLRIATWPTDTVHDARNRQVVGIFMPKLSGYKEIHTLYSPAQRKQEYPQVDWAFLVHTARNMAAAVATCHKLGHVIGDINPNNLVLSTTATVKLIDCDSFQIASNGRNFLCEVGVPHFTPPELHGKSFTSTVRTPNHDGFGLALLCFHLLFMGRHPFAGKYRNGTQDMPIERAIREFRFAYSASAAAKQMAPPPNSLGLEVVPTALCSMFEYAFGQQGVFGQRPSAAQWVQALEALEKELVPCSLITTHRYHRSMPACPWCVLEAQARIIFFVPMLHAGRKTTFDLDAVWNQIMGILIPGSAALPQYAFSLAAQPVQVPSGATAKEVLAQYGQEYQVRQSAVAATRRHWEQMQALWAQHLADKRLEIKRSDLRQLRDNYQLLAQQYQTERRKMEQQARGMQLHDYLDKYFIEHAKVSGIGPTRSATLASYGIETAADVTPQIMSIPGFGPTLTQELLNWRSSLERNFVFDPRKVAQLSGLVQLEAHFAARRAPLEKGLRDGVVELERLRQEILTERQALLVDAEKNAKAYQQAKVDFEDVNRQLRSLRKQAMKDLFISPLLRVLRPVTAMVILGVALYAGGPVIFAGIGDIIEEWTTNTPEVPKITPFIGIAPVPTQTARPSPSPTLTNTPQPTATVASRKSVQATVAINAWMYRAPDTASDTLGDIPLGEEIDIVGRVRTNTWCQVQLTDGRRGWVYCVLLDIAGDLSEVPITQ